jgi:hypothetical protein
MWLLAPGSASTRSRPIPGAMEATVVGSSIMCDTYALTAFLLHMLKYSHRGPDAEEREARYPNAFVG